MVPITVLHAFDRPALARRISRSSSIFFYTVSDQFCDRAFPTLSVCHCLSLPVLGMDGGTSKSPSPPAPISHDEGDYGADKTGTHLLNPASLLRPPSMYGTVQDCATKKRITPIRVSAKEPHPSGLRHPPLVIPLAEGSHRYLTMWTQSDGCGNKQLYGAIMPPSYKTRLYEKDWNRIAEDDFYKEWKLGVNYLHHTHKDPEQFYTGLDLRAPDFPIDSEIINLRPEMVSTYHEQVIVEKDRFGEVFLKIYPPIMDEAQLEALFSRDTAEDISTAIRRLKKRPIIGVKAEEEAAPSSVSV